jgi:peptide-methionine (S)-S-oxide reductase
MFIFFTIPSPIFAAKNETATFAGGCFWSMQHDFNQVPGVIKITMGYGGSNTES